MSSWTKWVILMKGSFDYSNVSMSSREIEYSKSILNEKVYYFNQEFYPVNRDEPSKRLSETLTLSSIYVGTGLIYKIRSNEND